MASTREQVAAAELPLGSAAGRAARPASRLRLLLGNAGIKVLSLASLLILWAIVASFYPPSFLPGPVQVLGRMVRLVTEDQFFFHAYHTVLRVLAGFTLAFLSSIAAGIAMGTNRKVERFMETYILVGLTIPGLAWALLALMWFGITEFAPVFAIFVVTSPMIAVNMWQGTKAIDKELLDMAHAFRASRGSVVRDVIVPQLLPYLFAGTRFGFALGWKVVVLSEMFGLSAGIGYMINRSFSLYSMESVLAWTLSFTLLMVVFEYGVLKPLEDHFTRWRPAIAH